MGSMHVVLSSNLIAFIVQKKCIY